MRVLTYQLNLNLEPTVQELNFVQTQAEENFFKISPPSSGGKNDPD
jgi:hypothetical protein